MTMTWISGLGLHSEYLIRAGGWGKTSRIEGADYFSKTVGFVPGYDSIDQTISACGLPLAV